MVFKEHMYGWDDQGLRQRGLFKDINSHLTKKMVYLRYNSIHPESLPFFLSAVCHAREKTKSALIKPRVGTTKKMENYAKHYSSILTKNS